MIFHKIKKMQKVVRNQQAGVTLLLAILLLSSILSISFSLATVLFIEVRTSADLIRTDSAYYGASGIAEQSLYNLRRHVPSPSYQSSFFNNSSLNGQPIVTSTTTPTFQDVVLANSTFAGTTNIYSFCEATAGSTGCGYGKLVLTYLPTGNTDPLVAYLCQFNPNANYVSLPCTDQNNNYYWISTNTINGTPDAGAPNSHGILVYPTTNVNQRTWNIIDSTKQQELILYTTSNNPIYVSIQTFSDQAGTVPKGLPLSGKSSVNINVINGATGRKLQVIVPN
jgi:hypothetical protein